MKSLEVNSEARLAVARVVQQLRWDGVWWDVHEVEDVVDEVLRKLEFAAEELRAVIEHELREMAEEAQTAEMVRVFGSI